MRTVCTVYCISTKVRFQFFSESSRLPFCLSKRFFSIVNFLFYQMKLSREKGRLSRLVYLHPDTLPVAPGLKYLCADAAKLI